jgi:membrane dipeptidase
VNRREFSSLIAGTAVAALLRSSAFAQQSGSEVSISPEAAELYRRALILDCNSGPAGTTGDLPIAQSALDINRNSGVSVIKLSMGGINSNLLATVEEIAYFQRMIEVHPDCFLQVRVPADMGRAKREGKLGIIFSFESADMLEGNCERIELFRDFGVRVMQLSYNRKSPFAAGVMEPNGGGLTQLGKDAVKRMNAVGVAIDLSHANPQTTTEAIAASSKPVVVTHAGCAAVHPHPRNKTDEQLRALAAKGGVMGIYDLPYLTPSPKQPTVDDYMAHMEHALKVMGEEHVGVGSDVGIGPFDTSPKGMAEFNKEAQQRRKAGLAAPEEDRPTYVMGLNIPRRIEVIADQLLKCGYSAQVAEKVIGANFVRVFSEIWTA